MVSLTIVETSGFLWKEDDYFGLKLHEFDDCVTDSYWKCSAEVVNAVMEFRPRTKVDMEL